MRFLARLLSVVIPLSLMLGGPSQAREWEVIKSSGTILAATEGGFQPFNYYDGPKLTGFEVDLAEAIAKKLGLKLEWKVVAFDAQLAALKQDRFDFAIASHGYTEERAKSVDFANPHYCTGGQIAAAKDGPLTVASLNGKTVGVQLATTYADAARKIKGLKNVKTYKGDPEAFSALRAKKVDAWISDKFTVKATLDKNPDAGISGWRNGVCRACLDDPAQEQQGTRRQTQSGAGRSDEGRHLQGAVREVFQRRHFLPFLKGQST
jgi:polar amino acid transport system substrate-binding protein